MIVCLDLDGVVTDAPEFYKALMCGLRAEGNEVYILSGIPDSSTVTPADLTQKKNLLAELGCDGCYDKLIAVAGPEKNVAQAKVDYMTHVGASVLIDDRKRNVKAAQRAGFLGLRHKAIRA